MTNSNCIIIGLSVVMALVLFLPFLSKRIEETLEAFLLIMGIASVTISNVWSWHLIKEAIREPLLISVAVLAAGLSFRAVRAKMQIGVRLFVQKFGQRPFLFLLISGLALLSSLITAIIAAVILAEVMTILKISRKHEIRVVILACFAIGFGAALTPMGEPLATIAVSKLKGSPHYADFFFLTRLLALWVVPIIILISMWGASYGRGEKNREVISGDDNRENVKDVVARALKIYLFIMALVLLGSGFTPIVDKYLIQVPANALYWINIVSAALDNATLAAAEISPLMDIEKIRDLLLGLLISGGMLIPGNIPNIICAHKLSIKSKEWALFGFPLGLCLMIIYFIIMNVGSFQAMP
jgi:predicted cation transporter